ncbi:MAG: 16S rRNA (cytidine(1402)-2'-O)-methyltransferase [Gammaproteobacteria bacterium]|nr:16S rRNA (cytidine(1402)-2'-O)-methyltransferase [Gammaproteobacteria bacterium]
MTTPPGTLYVVATPIGNLDDMTPRAVEVLRTVALVAAEDTRVSRPLLQRFGITTPLVSLHEHNERHRAPGIIARLQAGEQVALISDAGTPLVSDPGYHLVAAAHEAGVTVLSLPGANAVVTLLAAAGLPGGSFCFAGFPPVREAERRRFFRQAAGRSETLVYFEAPHRIAATLADMAREFGDGRLAAVGRELTKRFEEVKRAPLEELVTWVQAEDGRRLRGEFVVAVAGNPIPVHAVDGIEPTRLLEALLSELPPARAAALAAKVLHRPKKELYRLALTLAGRDDRQ